MPVLVIISLLLTASLNADRNVFVSPAVPAPEEGGVVWKGYGDALTVAGEQKKKVIIDVYTDWCGWCKKMDKNVYANEKVRKYLDEHFVPVKLNAESKTAHDVKGKSMTETEIARAYGIRSYPTTVFLDSAGEPITVVPGYIDADKFVLVLRYINEEQYKTKKWDEFLSENS